MGDKNVEMVTREEKLILQMKNIESVVCSENITAEQKVYMITQQMSYLNEIVNTIIQPFREEAGNTPLIQTGNDIFVEFIEK